MLCSSLQSGICGMQNTTAHCKRHQPFHSTPTPRDDAQITSAASFIRRTCAANGKGSASWPDHEDRCTREVRGDGRAIQKKMCSNLLFIHSLSHTTHAHARTRTWKSASFTLTVDGSTRIDRSVWYGRDTRPAARPAARRHRSHILQA